MTAQVETGLRLASSVFPYIYKDRVITWIDNDIDLQLLSHLESVYALRPYQELDPIEQYPLVHEKTKEAFRVAQRDAHFNPWSYDPIKNCVLLLFAKLYNPVTHERSGEILDSMRAGNEQFLPIRMRYTTGMYPVCMEILQHELLSDRRSRRRWLGFNYSLDASLNYTSMTITNIAVAQQDGELRVGFFPTIDLTKPVSRDEIQFLTNEFLHRAGIKKGLFVSSSPKGGHFIGIDRLYSRNDYLTLLARIGLTNHIEAAGMEGYHVDDRHIDHVFERHEFPHQGVRIIGAPPLKPFVPRLTASYNNAQITFLHSNRKRDILGRAALGAGLI